MSSANGSVIGTPDFMAPERISGQEGGSASDLWSLAMMLYAAVEGHHPLRRGSTAHDRGCIGFAARSSSLRRMQNSLPHGSCRTTQPMPGP